MTKQPGLHGDRAVVVIGKGLFPERTGTGSLAVHPPFFVHAAVPPAVMVRTQDDLAQGLGLRAAQAFDRAFQPVGGKFVALVQLGLEVGLLFFFLFLDLHLFYFLNLRVTFFIA